MSEFPQIWIHLTAGIIMHNVCMSVSNVPFCFYSLKITNRGVQKHMTIIIPCTATLLVETVSLVLWLLCFFHAAVMFMSNGFEIQLHTARFSMPLQIQMAGSNTSSNQEINTTPCYIR